MRPVRAIFFDVAHTLLDKPTVIHALHAVMARHGIVVPLPQLRMRHRLMMEAIVFPDRTSRGFYAEFNAALLRSVGAVPSDSLLGEMFDSCSYQPWVPYDDVPAIASLRMPRGILSNWDTTLREKLRGLVDVEFDWILGSAEQLTRKPDASFFRLMLEATGLEPSQVAYVGDSMRLDIEPAWRMGFHAILLDRDDVFPHSTVARIASLNELGQML
jgi:FMN phosphatase YigB (HAD superfamily)